MRKERRLWIYGILALVWIVSGCAASSAGVKKPPSRAKTVTLYQAKSLLAQDLAASVAQHTMGRIAVADLIGPGEQITGLGEHLSDKLSLELLSSGRFPDFMERKQLRQLLATIKEQNTGYFDQTTAARFGKMIGVDCMVIGTVQDLGTYYDTTVKIVRVETGSILGGADAQLEKDETTTGLAGRRRVSTLTITVVPPVSGKVVAGAKQGFLQQGMVTLTGIPYGECSVVVHPEGHEAVRRSYTIGSSSEALSISLQRRTYDVSFQIIPPDAELVVDGRQVALNQEGHAKIAALEVQQYSYVIRAEGHRDRMGTFNPEHERLITLNLETTDPFYELKNKLFKTVQQAKSQGGFSIRLWTNQKEYRLGDKIRFYFRSERDCYLNLVDVTSTGEIRLIFPNRFHSNSFIKGGRTYRIPGDDYGFSFEVEPPVGRERVFAIASTHPLDIFGHDFQREAFYTMTRGNTRGAGIRGIGVKMDNAEISSASECVIQIRDH
jgi:hypothetical protein